MDMTIFSHIILNIITKKGKPAPACSVASKTSHTTFAGDRTLLERFGRLGLVGGG